MRPFRAASLRALRPVLAPTSRAMSTVSAAQAAQRTRMPTPTATASTRSTRATAVPMRSVHIATSAGLLNTVPTTSAATPQPSGVAASATSDTQTHVALAPSPQEMLIIISDRAFRASRAELTAALTAPGLSLTERKNRVSRAFSNGVASVTRAMRARAGWVTEEWYEEHKEQIIKLAEIPARLLSGSAAKPAADAEPAAAASGSDASAAAPAAGAADDADKKKKKKSELSDSEWQRVLDDVGASFKSRAASSSSGSSGSSGSSSGSKKSSGPRASSSSSSSLLGGNNKKSGSDNAVAEDRDREEEPSPELPRGLRIGLSVTAGFLVWGLIYEAIRALGMYNNSWKDFKSLYLDNNLVKKVTVHDTRAVAQLEHGPGQPLSDYSFTIPSREIFETNMELARNEAGAALSDWVAVSYVPEFNSGNIVSALISLGIIYFMARFLMGVPGALKGGGGAGGLLGGRTKAPFTLITSKNAKTRFTDVAGIDEAKGELMEFVDFLRNPTRYHKLGARIPKGALLVGPPGTGKTLLAKAVAGEAGVPFFSIAGSDFNDMFVGIGGARMRDLFKEARKAAPSIIFIDEIDAIGRARGGRGMANEERDSTLIQMLVEMDGFKTTENVVVLAGTNRVDVLDKALLRPGRFDRRIAVDTPDIKGRVAIFKVHLAKVALNHEINDLAARLAALTPGMVGADIANICNEGALIAARLGKDAVDLVDFEGAIDRVIGGMARPNHIMNARERRLVAYHEAGHAVTGWFLEFAEPLLKVTIVPRTGGALGFAQYLPNELTLLQTPQLLDQITMTLGGRAAEKVFFDKISTGASNDLEQAHRVAQGMINVYGMSDKLPNFSFPRRDDQFYKPVSEQTSQVIDEEVRAVIDQQYERALKLVAAQKDKVAALAEALLEKETINHDGLVAILGPRPFPSDAYLSFLDMQKQSLKRLQHPSEAKTPEDDPAIHQGQSGPDPLGGMLAPNPVATASAVTSGAASVVEVPATALSPAAESAEGESSEGKGEEKSKSKEDK